MARKLKRNAAINLGSLLPTLPLDADLASKSVSTLCLDSREIRPGDTFVAVLGSVCDGRKFISNALNSGAALILEEASDDKFSASVKSPVPVVEVPYLAQNLSRIAARFYGEPSRQMHLVGITGTNGKTTCSVLLAQLNSRLQKKSAVIGTLGFGLLDKLNTSSDLETTGLTTPDAIRTQEILAELLEQGATTVVMEVSSHSLDQARVAAVNFDVAIFTNLSRDHLDYHGTLEAYGQAKRRLFEMPDVRCAIINGDDAYGESLARSLQESQASVLRYSIVSADADIRVVNVEYSGQGVSADFMSPWGSGALNSQLLGPYNLSNLLAVIAAACEQGHSLKDVLAEVPNLLSVDGRMQSVDVTADIQVIVDYAHTPDALEKTLQALRPHTHNKLWSVFGCGGNRDLGKRPLMAAISESLADHVVATSDNPRHESPEAILADVAAGFKSSHAHRILVDRREAIAYALAQAEPGDTVLIAGKGHEDYQLVGDQVLPFSDIVEARKALALRKAKSVGGGQ